MREDDRSRAAALYTAPCPQGDPPSPLAPPPLRRSRSRAHLPSATTANLKLKGEPTLKPCTVPLHRPSPSEASSREGARRGSHSPSSRGAPTTHSLSPGPVGGRTT